jgi:hypothetical protein
LIPLLLRFLEVQSKIYISHLQGPQFSRGPIGAEPIGSMDALICGFFVHQYLFDRATDPITSILFWPWDVLIRCFIRFSRSYVSDSTEIRLDIIISRGDLEHIENRTIDLRDASTFQLNTRKSSRHGYDTGNRFSCMSVPLMIQVFA